MERLTRRIESGKADCAYCIEEFDKEFNCKNSCALKIKQLEKLAYLEDLIEQGKLIELKETK